MRVATGGGGHIGQVTALGRSVCTWPRWRPMALCAPVPRRISSVTTTRRLIPYAYVTNVYVPDLAVAYLRAPGRWLPARYDVFNFGNGNAYSVREMIRTVQLVASRRQDLRLTAPRPRDPAVLVASAARTRRELGWWQAAPTWSR